MPKRSNEFQKLIKLIETQLASDEIKIEESKLLNDFRTGKEREIDIYIESTVNNHKVRIALECRDRKRKADIQWIDDLIGKYQYLPVDKVIAISKSGFYNPVIEAAKKSKIDLFTLENAKELNWVRAVKNIDSIFLTLVRFRPIEISFESDKALFEKEISNIEVYSQQKDYLGNLMEYSHKILGYQKINSQIYAALTSSYDDKKESFKNGGYIADAKWEFNKNLFIKDNFDFQAYLKSITYKFKCEVNKASVPTKKFSYNNAQVATISKELHDMKIIMSVSERQNKKPTLAISMEMENESGEKVNKEIITAPLPTYKGPINLTRFVLG